MWIKIVQISRWITNFGNFSLIIIDWLISGNFNKSYGNIWIIYKLWKGLINRIINWKLNYHLDAKAEYRLINWVFLKT